ncbi:MULTISPECIES: SDR family oxidoreductase [unclassified Phyllobacterium]|uniref:SDR family oxidoreductase n=1 Tax=Phyllobacterium TaxID=28100 RepID=UPI000DDC9B25|nr:MULTISPECIES: SDR family oxidoreductase [unclassified Phyllobacterium]MBA8900302.1 NAD(P)-dependent dehydrogenase (short-subunit alcohol dehydrogenase family) [Phyllobacterium sp. P30BS-XVII]UGX86261.1 SDR family oxidoreductase [Phyllobacterium sp. T1293]
MTSSRTVLITGCSSGIGAYCARALQADGWQVFATARRDEDIAALKADGLSAHYLDYREPDSIKALVETVLAKTGGTLDALYNNGAYALPGAVEDLPIEGLREQFDANFFGWHELTRHIVPVMRRQGHGRIVHCSSILGLVPMKWRGAYVSSKFALEGLMLVQRMELEGSGIHVSLIEPGPIESRFTYNALKQIEKYIDVEGSVHRADYQKQIARLSQGGTKSRAKLGPDAVYSVLKHALENPRPKPHYLVTRPAKFAVFVRRFLSSRALYRMLAGQS